MAFTIDELEIIVDAEAKKSTKGIDALAASLGKVKTVLSSGGLISNLNQISTALKSLSSIPKVSFTSMANGIKKLDEATASLNGNRLREFSVQMQGIAAGLSHLNGVGKSGLATTVNAIKKIPDITKSLDTTTLEQFASTVKHLTEIMSPLATEMDKVGRGFSAMPSSVRKAIKASKDYVDVSRELEKSQKSTFRVLSDFVNQYRRLYHAIDKTVDVFAALFKKSNEYVEALNLFKVSMGDASSAALEYAESLRSVMGIDPAEWITNQGLFQRMTTGFGIASDEAEIMSKNLTQLAYDMSSFFNTDVGTAMDKLQSGMSGQIKGLKEWGYNLSVAALQETALAIGIEQSVRTMTEAQKAQLRYITLIQRSKGVMGDMAKTINTPANSMRILGAQIEQLERSFGNIISVLLTRFIPYIQAGIELLSEFAASWAEALGFEIKDLPTNNLDMAADIIDGIGDNVDDTTDEIAALKKQLMGFDELNILTNPKKDEEEIGNNYSLDIELPEYDFLANLDTQTREKIDEIKSQIKELLPLVEALGQALALVFAVKLYSDAKNGIKHFFTEMKLGKGIVDIFTGAMEDANIVFEAGDGIFKSLKTGVKSLAKNFKSAMSSLSPFTKALVSVVALGIEFGVVKDAVYDLTKGNKSLGESLLAIIPTCAAVGVAMYAMLGPWGLVAAAITAVVGAVTGFVKAEKELRRQLVHDEFYDGYGATLGDLATKFDELLDSSIPAFDAISEGQADIIEAKENIKDTKTEIALLVFEVTNGATTIEAAIPRMTKAFADLYNDSKDYLLKTATLLYTALTGSSIEGAQLYAETIAKITGASIEAIDEQNKRLEEAKKQLDEGKIDYEQYFEIFLDVTANTSKWTSVESAFKDKVGNALGGLSDLFANGINWKSENLFGDLQAFKTAADDAKTQISTAYQSIYDGIAEMRKNAVLLGDTESVNILDAMLKDFEAEEANDLLKVDNQLKGLLYGFQENLAERMKEAYDAGLAEYDDLNWFEKLFYDFDPKAYASQKLYDFRDEVAPIIEDLKKVFGDDSIFGDDIFFDEVIEKVVDNYGQDGTWIEEAFNEAAKDTVNGLVSGLSDEQKTVYDEALALGKTVLEAYDEALGIHSPSKEMQDRGEYTLQGLANGLGNTSLLEVAIDNIVKQFDILSPIKNLWNKVTNWWKNISLPDINLFGNLGAKISGAFNIGQYASGGFPSMGQMFIAREAGPELVGRIGSKNAVANNDQIISGIASAVYGAMMAANEDSNNEGSNARIVVQIGDTPIGEAAVRFINGQIIQTGVNPIYN